MFSEKIFGRKSWIVEWSDEYETGEKTVDDYHKAIVENSNKIYRIVSEEKDVKNYDDLLRDTIKLIFDHFDYENKLFMESRLEGAEEHIKKNNEIKEVIYSIGALTNCNIKALMLNHVVVFYTTEHLVIFG